MLLGGAAYWVERGSAPRLVAAGYDRIVSFAFGKDPFRRCVRLEGDVMTFIGPRACYTFESPRKFAGIYIDEFEGQRFVEGANGDLPIRATDRVWFSYDEKSDLSAVPQFVHGKNSDTRVWRVRFVGRKTSGKGGFGHFGMSDSHVLVDRVESAKWLYRKEGYLTPSELIRPSN
jgi:hypothetical protein